MRVTASDGALTSPAVTSAAVTVVNSAPTASVTLSPTNPGTNQILTATATRADADADTVTLTYVWKVNGVVKRTQQTAALTDTFDLSQAGNGDGGDIVTAEVTPNDGTDVGTSATASATVDGTPRIRPPPSPRP